MARDTQHTTHSHETATDQARWTELAQAIAAWDREDVRELRELLRALEDELAEPEVASQFGVLPAVGERVSLAAAGVDLTDLPSAPIPDWVDTAWPVWARDRAGRHLVGDTADEVVTEDELREEMLED